MELKTLTVENFRCYKSPISIEFDQITAIVGVNDVGKSTLMDALSVFFETEKPDKDDLCKANESGKIIITCEFSDTPKSIVIDADFETTLEEEYLLSDRGTLVIQKTYSGASMSLSSVCAISRHPTRSGYEDLLSLKRSDLIKRAQEKGVDLTGVDQRKNAPIRQEIWRSCDDLEFDTVPVPLSAENGKQVWSALQQYLPIFALFKSDRASTDQDAEAQDPLQAAIREAVKSVEDKLLQVQGFVENEVKKIAAETVAKLREMDPGVAETLNPVIKTKRWDSLFSTSITGDEGIPLNKRGSGVKRLVLLNFFRAKAEKDAMSNNRGSVIYAIEEPETSQHPRNQRLLLGALRDLSTGNGRQVIVTTHTPMLARYLDDSCLRLITRDEGGVRKISSGQQEEIAKSLGVLADHNVKLFIGVEGPNDINFLKGMCAVLRQGGEEIPDISDLELRGEIVFVPLGGSTLALWASRLAVLNRPEFYLCDRDEPPPNPPKYNDFLNQVNSRENASCVVTEKREMENYIHHEAIVEAYAANGISGLTLGAFGPFEDVPLTVAHAVFLAGGGSDWGALSDEKRSKKQSMAKKFLNREAVQKMSIERLSHSDPDREVLGWFKTMQTMIAGSP